MEINSLEPVQDTQEVTEVKTEQVPDNTTTEQIVDSEQATQTEPTADPILDNSATESTPVTETQVEETVQVQGPVYDDSSVLQYLNEKLGKEFNSFEDFNTPAPAQQELPEDVQQILEWKEKTGRPLNDWVKFQKDYDNMSDEQIVREYLQVKYPGLDVEAELKAEYLPTEDDLDSDISRKNRSLTKLAIDGRKELNNLRMQFNTPAEGYQKLTPEIQSELDFAKQVRDNIKNQEATQQQYNASIKSAASELSSIPLNLAEGTSINFNIDDAVKKSLPEMVNKMPHWYNQDGSLNHSAMVKDVAIVSQIDKIVQLAYEQGRNSGVDSQTKKENNITLDTKSMDANSKKTTPRFTVEGQDSFFNKNRIQVKRR
jgi:hypothetical protein